MYACSTSVRRQLCLIAGLAAFGLLQACTSDGGGESPNLFAGLPATNAGQAQSPAKTASPGYGPIGASTADAAQLYPGEDVEPTVAQRSDDLVQYADASGQLASYGHGSYQLNFEAADINAVCKAILGEILAVNYMIDPHVNGQVTLTSAQPIDKSKLLPLLEAALSTINASLVKDGDLYRIVPATATASFQNVDTGADSEGFGTTVIAAKYVPAQTIAHILEGLDNRPGAVRADPSTNYVLVQGSASERKAAVDAASLVDVDWLKSRSVAILPIVNSSPDTIISELNRILDTGQGGLSQDIVQLQPMARLNAVLAVSRRREAIDQVTRWVTRLDRVDPNSGIKIYRLQYAQAKNVAAMVNAMFGASQQNSGDKQDNLLEPTTKGNGAQGTGTQGNTTNSSASTIPAANVDGSADMNTGQSANQSAFGILKTAFSKKATATDDSSNFAALNASDPSGVRVTADPGSNSLFIKASAEQYKSIERAIRQMDRPPLQVDIEATIAEVTLNKDLQYGVQFYLQSHSVALGLPASSVSTAAVGSGLNLLVGAAANPKLLLSALQSVTAVKVLSSPSLVVVDQQPAVLQVGDQVPVLTQSAQSTLTSSAPIVSSVDYKDTGIILNVLPKINSNGSVTLDIEQEISSVADASTQTLTPTISQRRVRSTVAVHDGQTVMLAGLISETQNSSRDGIPGISQIGFLRDLLASHDTSASRDELVIFIKPQIITNPVDAARVTQEFRDRLTSMQSQVHQH